MMKAMVAVAVLAVAAQAWAEPDSPYRQHLDGVPLEGIDCKAGLVLIGSPDGVPACVTEGTALVLSERGWAAVERAVPERVVTDSRDLPVPEYSVPRPYPLPTVVADYPNITQVGEEYSVYIDFTYSLVDNPHILPDSFEQDIQLILAGPIEILSDGFTESERVFAGLGGPYEYSTYQANKIVSIDSEVWQRDEIRFRINEPVNALGNVMHVGIGGTFVSRWLDTDDEGTVTFLQEDNSPDVVADLDATVNTNQSYATEPPDTTFVPPPIDDSFYWFIKNNIQPHEDVAAWLRDAEIFDQEYIDELLATYPDLGTRPADIDRTAAQSSRCTYSPPLIGGGLSGGVF